LDVKELVLGINEIDATFSAINQALGLTIFVLISFDMVGGVSSMFLLAEKISSQKDIFEEDDPIFFYLIYIFYIQLKTITFSYITYNAHAKV
jgi:hypothetical protein